MLFILKRTEIEGGTFYIFLFFNKSIFGSELFLEIMANKLGNKNNTVHIHHVDGSAVTNFEKLDIISEIICYIKEYCKLLFNNWQVKKMYYSLQFWKHNVKPF